MNTTRTLVDMSSQGLSELPETVNYHFTSSCNMRCSFCFAGFKDCSRDTLTQHIALIHAIAAVPSTAARSRRLNFVGGEPTIYPYFDVLLEEAHSVGLRTSVVTNGFSLSQNGISDSFQSLELLGLSIDSLNPETCRRMGRCVGDDAISAQQWLHLAEEAKTQNLPLKINTTVTASNVEEDLSGFVEQVAPARWKVFQAMVVKGQNETASKQWAVDDDSFQRFIVLNSKRAVTPVVEQESLMRGSYAMISPDGRFFDSTAGMHSYSEPILDVGVDHAWNQVDFDSELFDERMSSNLKYAA